MARRIPLFSFAGWRHAASAATLAVLPPMLLADAAPLAGGLPAPETSLVFRVGMAESCFQEVNHNDAVAACRVFTENLGRRLGYEFRAEPVVFESDAALEAAVRSELMHVLVVETSQYLRIPASYRIQPAYVALAGGQVGRKLVVLTRRDSALTSVAQLRGHPVLRMQRVNDTVGRSWVRTLLPDQPVEEADAFFDGCEVVSKPSAAVLPVFFGKKDACIVDDVSFQLMRELNPQVGRVLQPIAESPRLLELVICVRDYIPDRGWPSPQARADAIRGLADLQLDPAGRQILTIFKINRLVPFEPEYLTATRALLAGDPKAVMR